MHCVYPIVNLFAYYYSYKKVNYATMYTYNKIHTSVKTCVGNKFCDTSRLARPRSVPLFVTSKSEKKC